MNRISLSDIISQLSIALDAVEAELLGATRYHSKRVCVLCLAIGNYMGYDEEHLFNLAGCALLHDNALTEYILSEKPGESQALNIRSHCIIGQNNCGYFPFPGTIEGFVLYHHEYADGSGAFGKKYGEYPEEAGIIALADQIDVKYPMQKLNASGLEKVRQFIRAGTGRRFDPAAAEAALAVLDQAFLDRVSDENVSETIRSGLPDVVRRISNQDIVSLSGIIARIIDYKSEFTQEHSIQIANKAWYMGGIYHYPEELRADIYLAAAFHDIGKLFIPGAILEKPGRLTDEEFEIIKSHAQYTWNILKVVRGFEEIAVWASDHHEKLDGTGYPFGKTGSRLDFNSRLLACLDIYQAVREKRPYHPVRSHKETMKILYDMAGRGLVDEGITRDLDEALAKLPDGCAAAPDTMNRNIMN